jgi:hypothetical protein
MNTKIKLKLTCGEIKKNTIGFVLTNFKQDQIDEGSNHEKSFLGACKQ